ncbi:hypothetical protein [Kribbella catacumbae]|nr:hypothetical protein [Kribbella catacumbae]
MELPGDGHVHSEWSWDAGLSDAAALAAANGFRPDRRPGDPWLTRSA